MMGCASLGLVCGPIFGGLLTERVTWRLCFYINLPVGGITGGILAFMHIPDSKQADSHLATREQKGKRLDIPGFILFTPTIIMLLLALEWGGVTYRWNSSVVIGLFCGAGVAWIIFLLWERRQGEGVSPNPFPNSSSTLGILSPRVQEFQEMRRVANGKTSGNDPPRTLHPSHHRLLSTNYDAGPRPPPPRELLHACLVPSSEERLSNHERRLLHALSRQSNDQLSSHWHPKYSPFPLPCLTTPIN